MNTTIKGVILGVTLLLLAGGEAVADDPVMIRVYNDSAESIDLSVYDLNAQPPDAVIVNQRINGFAWIPISVTAGAVGKGHVKWIARTVDPTFHRCGSREMRGVENESFVHVFADSSCR